jgi:TonB family protein
MTDMDESVYVVAPLARLGALVTYQATPRKNFTNGHSVSAVNTRKRSAFVLPLIVCAHVALGWALVTATRVAQPLSPFVVQLMAQVIETNNPAKQSTGPPPALRPTLILVDPADPVMGLPPPPRIELAQTNGEAVRAAPQLLDSSPIDTAPFAKRGGLLPGESAVVVLRIEVLPDGKDGDVQIDVSSGSDQVDRAAIDYARLLEWIPGTFRGTGERTWIRHSVRLAA